MFVPEINKVKEHLTKLKEEGLILDWELPYENLLTRGDAAIYFLAPADESEEHLDKIWDELKAHDDFSWRLNEPQKLSKLKYRITFSKEEKEKNEKMKEEQNQAK